jgi:hypothetical protein
MDDLFHGDENINGGVDIHGIGSQPLHVEPNILGGTNTFEGGQLIDHSNPNLLGGLDHHGSLGGFHSHPNLLGGVDFVSSSGQPIGHTQGTILGGQQMFGPDNQLIGEATPDANGFHGSIK